MAAFCEHIRQQRDEDFHNCERKQMNKRAIMTEAMDMRQRKHRQKREGYSESAKGDLFQTEGVFPPEPYDA